MKHRTGLLAIPAFVVAAAAFAAAPALAATTFTVSPGGAWSGSGSGGGIRDAVSNQVTRCSGSALAGSFKSGRGLSGTNIGALTSIALTGCQVHGVAVTITVHTSAANPAPMSLTGVWPPGSATFTGQATNISLTLDDANGCHAEVGAKTINGGGPGVAGFTYNSTDAQLSFAAGTHGLFVQSATPQCNAGVYHGLAVQQGERIDLNAAAVISPAQTISSP
jgi:hypothetical protein